MGKLAVISRSFALVLCIVLSGYAEAKSLPGQEAPATLTSPVSVGGRFSPSEVRLPAGLDYPSVNYPVTPHALIPGLLYDCSQPDYWVRPDQFQGLGDGFARTEHGMRLAATNSGMFMPGGQTILPAPELVGGNLSSLSPPGLVLRL